MRRTLILSALGAITLSIGFGVGAALATTTPVRPPTTMMDGQDTCHMNGAANMMQMMDDSAHSAHHRGVQP